MEVTPDADDPNTNPQLTEKIFIRIEYVFHIDGTNKKMILLLITKHTNYTKKTKALKKPRH